MQTSNRSEKDAIGRAGFLANLRPGGFDALIFSAKASISAVLAFLCYQALDLPGAAWAPVSALIVTQPTLHPSLRASLYRLAANIVGVSIGALAARFVASPMVCLAVGVLLTGLVCHFTHLDDGLRAAYAAVVIVILGNERNAFAGSIDRVLAVIIGCLSALLVGVIFHFLFFMRRTPANSASSNNE